MSLRRRLPRIGSDEHRAVILAVACFVVIYTYLGIRFTLFAGMLVFLNGTIGGLLLGLSIGGRDESIAAAVAMSLISIVSLFVVFLVDDFRIVNVFGVPPPMIRFDSGSLGLRLLAFIFQEIVILMALGPYLVVTALAGAWLGSTLRIAITNEAA